jgi:TfoX/Sxy family transcriptional regulator of competence genes
VLLLLLLLRLLHSQLNDWEYKSMWKDYAIETKDNMIAVQAAKIAKLKAAAASAAEVREQVLLTVKTSSSHT